MCNYLLLGSLKKPHYCILLGFNLCVFSSFPETHMKIKCTSCHNYNFKLQNVKRTQFEGGGVFLNQI